MASMKPGKPDKKSKHAKQAVFARLGTMRNSAQEVWRAGLGAVAKAQDTATEAAARVKEKMLDAGVADVADKLLDRFSQLGQVVEGHTAQALSRAGVATKKDVDTLSRRVSKLGAEVEKLVLAKKPITKRALATRKAVPSASAIPSAKSTVESQPGSDTPV